MTNGFGRAAFLALSVFALASPAAAQPANGGDLEHRIIQTQNAVDQTLRRLQRSNAITQADLLALADTLNDYTRQVEGFDATLRRDDSLSAYLASTCYTPQGCSDHDVAALETGKGTVPAAGDDPMRDLRKRQAAVEANRDHANGTDRLLQAETKHLQHLAGLLAAQRQGAVLQLLHEADRAEAGHAPAQGGGANNRLRMDFKPSPPDDF